jgi:hypothetical protein
MVSHHFLIISHHFLRPKLAPKMGPVEVMCLHYSYRGWIYPYLLRSLEETIYGFGWFWYFKRSRLSMMDPRILDVFLRQCE